jgi:SAM-dependent methyltransferase
MEAKYDIIASNYAELRKPDPRIARIIARALGPAQAILNVGAGTGSYEPAGRSVTAVEPSRQMIAKRGPMAARVVEASAGALPFADKSFDASMAILTIHHWPDKEAGLREMRRVTRGPIVLLTFDPAQRPWLTDYLPDLVALDDVQMLAMSDYGRWLGPVQLHRFWCRMIAAMVSSMPIGADQRPISIPSSAPAARPSGRFTTPRRDCRGCGAILKPAPGRGATPACSTLRNMMPDTGWSSPLDPRHDFLATAPGANSPCGGAWKAQRRPSA